MTSFAWRPIKLCVILASLVLIGSAASAQNQSNAASKPLPAGQVIDSVLCVADPSQAYALYLPSHYSAGKVWPIIYTFDPGARGKNPVESYKDTAERYGYIIAASNNSRNFGTEPLSRIVQAMWDDTHLRLSIDARRIYTMGFSGGARVATTLAMRCDKCAVAGVIALGAAYPDSSPPSDQDHFAYFAIIGDKDFNWAEIMELRRKKEQLNAPFRLTVFEGIHQWAPAAVFGEAIEWLQLKAMQSGTAPSDPAFIEQMFARTQKEAENALQHKDAIAEFEAYRSLASDFSGWKDVSQFQAKLAALKSSAELKQAFKKQQEAIDKERALTQDLLSKLGQAAETNLDAQQALASAVSDGMATLKHQSEHEKNEEMRLVYVRAFNDVWVEGIETGEAELNVKKRYGIAEFYFRLMSNVTPDQAWPVLLLAETSALRGDKKRALKELREAVKRGIRHPESVEEDANLQSLRSEPEFQQMVAEVKAKRESQPAP